MDNESRYRILWVVMLNGITLSGNSSNTETIQYNFGANWWVDKDVVVKIDYQIQDVGSAISKDELMV